MLFCTLAGPDPQVFNRSRRGAEAGKPLLDWGRVILSKRCEPRLVPPSQLIF